MAGHANAARGADILWIFGADEKAGIVGADPIELSDWTAQLKACFDGPIPQFTDIQIDHKGKTCTALGFDTGLAPYVVKNQKGGAITSEVPWREGTAVRTATRADLLLILAERHELPDIEVLHASLEGLPRRTKSPQQIESVLLRLDIYITPREIPLIIPLHRIFSEVEINGKAGMVKTQFYELDHSRARYAPRSTNLATRSLSLSPVSEKFAPFSKTPDALIFEASCAVQCLGKAKIPPQLPEDPISIKGSITYQIGADRISIGVPFNIHSQAIPEDPGIPWLF